MPYPQWQRNTLQCKACPETYGQTGAEVCSGKKSITAMQTAELSRMIRQISWDVIFEAETIHQKWCTDITYIHVQKEGWTYLGFRDGLMHP